jgi:hypothetical protein
MVASAPRCGGLCAAAMRERFRETERRGGGKIRRRGHLKSLKRGKIES